LIGDRHIFRAEAIGVLWRCCAIAWTAAEFHAFVSGHGLNKPSIDQLERHIAPMYDSILAAGLIHSERARLSQGKQPWEHRSAVAVLRSIGLLHHSGINSQASADAGISQTLMQAPGSLLHCSVRSRFAADSVAGALLCKEEDLAWLRWMRLSLHPSPGTIRDGSMLPSNESRPADLPSGLTRPNHEAGDLADSQLASMRRSLQAAGLRSAMTQPPKPSSMLEGQAESKQGAEPVLEPDRPTERLPVPESGSGSSNAAGGMPPRFLGGPPKRGMVAVWVSVDSLQVSEVDHEAVVDLIDRLVDDRTADGRIADRPLGSESVVTLAGIAFARNGLRDILPVGSHPRSGSDFLPRDSVAF